MRCTVYRSSRKEYLYLYLVETMKIDDLPESLNELFGEPEAVLRLDLTEVEKLANADPEAVKEGLREEGYYLQLPPKHPIEEEISRLFS